jgi:competence protein ComEA
MGRTLASAGAVLVAVVAAGMWAFTPPPDPPPLVQSGTVVGQVTVHVSGAVVAPGLVSVSRGARVADAVAAAGGALPGADLRGLNLAAPVSDGQQLVVPERLAGGSEGGGVAADGRVRVNTADVAAMEALPGVGPVLAERIVAHRDQHGPFAAVEDLLDVPGIGEGTLAGLRDAVLVP